MRISHVQLFMAALFIYNSAVLLFSFILLVFTSYILINLQVVNSNFKNIFSAMTLVNCAATAIAPSFLGKIIPIGPPGIAIL